MPMERKRQFYRVSSRRNHCNTGCYGTASGLLWTASDDDVRVQLGLHDLPHLPSDDI